MVCTALMHVHARCEPGGRALLLQLSSAQHRAALAESEVANTRSLGDAEAAQLRTSLQAAQAERSVRPYGLGTGSAAYALPLTAATRTRVALQQTMEDKLQKLRRVQEVTEQALGSQRTRAQVRSHGSAPITTRGLCFGSPCPSLPRARRALALPC